MPTADSRRTGSAATTTNCCGNPPCTELSPIRPAVALTCTRPYLLYGARNRIAHHEPIIHGVRRPGVPRTAAGAHRSVRQLHEDIVTVVRWLSAPLGDWIATNSRTPRLLDHPRQ